MNIIWHLFRSMFCYIEYLFFLFYLTFLSLFICFELLFLFLTLYYTHTHTHTDIHTYTQRQTLSQFCALCVRLTTISMLISNISLCVRVCVCVWNRERKRERGCVCVCVCVCVNLLHRLMVDDCVFVLYTHKSVLRRHFPLSPSLTIARAYTQTYTHSHTLSLYHAHTNTLSHTHTHTHTRAHTHTHTHALNKRTVPPSSWFFCTTDAYIDVFCCLNFHCFVSIWSKHLFYAFFQSIMVSLKYRKNI